MSMLSDYMENKLVDWLFRAQSFTPPAILYVGLLTADPADSGGGTEVAYVGYARVPVTSSLAAWAGTQGDGTTSASSGSSGVTSNNAEIDFPVPAADVGTPVTHFAIYDAATSGNRLIEGVITNVSGTPVSKSLTGGDDVTFPAGTLRINVDA